MATGLHLRPSRRGAKVGEREREVPVSQEVPEHFLYDSTRTAGTRHVERETSNFLKADGHLACMLDDIRSTANLALC